ncbi:major facilitator superfamily domain-containing protein [Trichoderma compactum]
MLIAARIIQGGRISVLVSIIVGDLVPLRYRQKYMAIVMSVFALGTFIGPIVGGAIVTRVSWRWTFYINLPVGGMRYPSDGAVIPRLISLDWSGHVLLSASVVSVLISLTWGGTKNPWDSGRVLESLILGGPSMPLHPFGNRTSLLGFVLTFLHGIIVLKEDFPLLAGVNVLALAIPFTPTWSGRNKLVLIAGLALLPIATGCFTLLMAEIPTAQWAVFQVIAGLGGGLAVTSTLPGVSIPAVVFNSKVDSLVSQIDNAQIRSLLAFGGAYEHATRVPIALFLREIPLRTKLETQYGLDESKTVAEPTNMDASLGNSAVVMELEPQDQPTDISEASVHSQGVTR